MRAARFWTTNGIRRSCLVWRSTCRWYRTSVPSGAALAGRPLGVGALVEQAELEERRLAEQGLGPFRVLHAGELDEDPVVALLLDGGLGHAELVDAVADGLEGLPDGEVAQCGDLAGPVGEDGPPRRRIALATSKAPNSREHRLRRRPRLGRGELDQELAGAAALDPGHGHALLLERGAETVGGALDLDRQGLVEIDAEDEVDASLEVEAEVHGLLRRVEVPDGGCDHRQDDADPHPELSAHSGVPCPRPGGRRPRIPRPARHPARLRRAHRGAGRGRRGRAHEEWSFSPPAGTIRPIAERSKSTLTWSATRRVTLCSSRPTTVP